MNNAFFTTDDPHPESLHGFRIPSGWWSRPYEYAWAMAYAKGGHVAADMGCGWNYRPLHDALSNVCDFVYGVDQHPGILELPQMQNGAFVVADFSACIPEIKAGSLDRIFCISVLEELPNYESALIEFRRLLKPDGLIVMTCDARYDNGQPEHEKYRGVDMDRLDAAIKSAGLAYNGGIDRNKNNALHNDELNLCVWHCVLHG